MDVPTEPGDALAQPTRARLFALLGELRRPAPTDELAARLELHPNGVRGHLERLHAAGLVVRERQRIARGRPRDTWSIDPTAQPGGDPPTGYAELAGWLARTMATGGSRVSDVEATGREIGRELAPTGTTAAPEQQIHDVLSSLGFQPERTSDRAGQATYRLRNCPYRQAVRERQALVCGLHRGMTQGLLEAIDPRTELVGFEPKDPDTAGCLIQLEGPTA